MHNDRQGADELAFENTGYLGKGGSLPNTKKNGEIPVSPEIGEVLCAYTAGWILIPPISLDAFHSICQLQHLKSDEFSQ